MDALSPDEARWLAALPASLAFPSPMGSVLLGHGVFIGVAKERCSSFRSNKAQNGFINFWRASVTCNHYYFYILDREWGPGFIKFSLYAPFGVKMCLNGVQRLDPDLPRDPTDELASAWHDLDEAVDNHIEAARIAA